MNDIQQISAALDGEIDPAFAARARFVLAHCLARGPERILDLGCGRGFYLSQLARCAFPRHLAGMDISAQNLGQAAALAARDGRVSLARADAAKLPYRNESFQFVICSEVLEHLTDPGSCLREIERVLTPGGHLAITVPHLNFPRSWDPLNYLLMRAFRTHVPKQIHWLAGIWADHERLYEREELRSIIAAHFEVLELRPTVRAAIPFSHFLIYGIGKNLVERGVAGSLSRFSEDPPGRLKRWAAHFMGIPSRVFPDCPDSDRSVNLCLLARKAV